MKKQVKLAVTILTKHFIFTVFRVIAILFPINQSKITFASYRAEELEGNLLYVYRALERENRDFDYVYLFKHYRSNIFGRLHYLLHMIKASFHLATSRYFIIDDFYFPVYCIKPRKGTDIVQLWHAAGAFKTFGHSTIGKSFGPDTSYIKHINIHSNYTKVFVSSSEVVPYYAEAFNMEKDNIIPLGVPRTDYFLNKQTHNDIKKRFLMSYPELEGKKLILYAPTFRGKSHYQGTFELPFDVHLLKNQLGDGYALLIHLHPYMNGALKLEEGLEGFAYHIHGGFDVQALMALSDLLITDYSSVIFDYSLLERPIAFYATDLDEYLQERGFYFPYKDFIPGPFFSKTEDLAHWIRSGDFQTETITAFRNRFFDYPDGKASERIVHYLMSQSQSKTS